MKDGVIKTVPNNIQTKPYLQWQLLPFYIEGTCHYAKGGPRTLLRPARQVNLDEAVMKWYAE
jgi:hypothetical protein